MAKITTRSASQSDDKVIAELQHILEAATNGVVSTKPTAMIPAGEDIPTLLEDLKSVIRLMNRTANRLFLDAQALAFDNTALSVRVADLTDLLEVITDVSYDDALDHATADLMDAFCAGGGADVTSHGELAFPSTIMYSKSDLKPILREAIVRYIDTKIL